ncbi:ATP-dependent RNA helicase [Spironucleus salmonicida]|uniref:ATP-dependent RNA helicase n=1 Tax=Spironucleus salmonicida TaxID=348837 RepID=V6LPK6_9EUKA|nr:ATP-dependent RNA helicase [Spironucleus salmonicida]|eukprot:EST46550.1 ATP-dependent RNA helicase [Spironucleus salmonicida]
MSKNKVKKEALRAQQLKRKRTLEQREYLFSQIRQNTNQINEQQHILIQSNRKDSSKATERKTISFKEKVGISITEQEKKKIYKQIIVADSDATQIIESIQYDGQQFILDEIVLPLAEVSIPQIVQNKGTLLLSPSMQESSISDPLAIISDFAEKYHIVKDAPIPKDHTSELPVGEKAFEIFEALENTDILILQAATGTGKSTQIPQYLLSHGYGVGRPAYFGKILVTQPRRIAAIGLASRVAQEWGSDRQISYAVRNESNTNKETKVLYLTEGVLLQILKQDALLSDVSCVILDEAHERSQQMDCCLGILQQIVQQRRSLFTSSLIDDQTYSYSSYKSTYKITPLKLIIMSATLQHSNYSGLKTALTIKLQKKTFPISVHYEKQTPLDIVQFAADKTVEVHRKYPPGAILIFLTGQSEVKKCCELLEDALYSDLPVKQQIDDDIPSEEDEFYQFLKPSLQIFPDKQEELSDKQLNIIEFDGQIDQEAQIQIETLQSEFKAEIGAPNGFQIPKEVIILPLYGALSLQLQQRIYQNFDNKTQRLIVVATNVAESSITVPSVRYVIDSAKVKEKTEENEVVQLQEIYASKANLQQRAGRAGRTCPGHAFRLISPGIYGQMREFQVPEIARIGLEQTCLLLLRIGVPDPRRFVWPEDFDRSRIPKALDRLLQLGAIVEKNKLPFLTKFGKKISDFPVSLPAATLISITNQLINVMAAAVIQSGVMEGITRQLPVNTGKGDFMDAVFTFGAYLRFNEKEKVKFCEKNQLVTQKYQDCQKVYFQLAKILGLDLNIISKPNKPTQQEMELLHLSLLRLYLRNVGTTDILRQNRYNIKQIDLRDYCKEQTKQIQEFMEKTPYMEKAYINKFSNLHNIENQFIVYKEIDLKLNIFEEKIRPQVLLRSIHPFNLPDLLPLAEFSPILDISMPLSFKLTKNLELIACVEAYYDSITIGQLYVKYPGKKAQSQFSDIEFLINKARVVGLMRGDFQVKIKSKLCLKVEFDKGMFQAIEIDQAAKLLKGKDKNFWRISSIVKEIEKLLQ